MFVLTKTIVSSTATLAIASATRRSPRPLAPDERSAQRNRAVRAGADERADSDGQAQTVRTLPSRRTASGGAFVERSQARLTTSSQEQRSATGRLDRPPASGSPDAEVAESRAAEVRLTSLNVPRQCLLTGAVASLFAEGTIRAAQSRGSASERCPAAARKAQATARTAGGPRP